MSKLNIATVQSEVSREIEKNGKIIRRFIKQAHTKGAHIVHFCEGALSGYTKKQLGSPEHINFAQIKLEIASIQNLARKYEIWVVFGCTHQLSEGNRPHNSLYVISDEGEIVNRYDKRKCSHNEITNWYSPGFDSCVFEIKGIKFSCLLCIEVNFPELFIESEIEDVDCILFSSYSRDAIYGIQCQGYAASHNYWISMAIPKNESEQLPSQMIGPDGLIIKKCVRTYNSMIVNEIDTEDGKWEIPLQMAKPWRRASSEGSIYDTKRVYDQRSRDKTIY